MHRYSVIDHEYFHVYQMSLSKNFFDGNIELKWMSEGGAATFESLYIQQHYSYNYFKDAQDRVDISAINNPSIFEKFSTSSSVDSNYSSSVFMFLVLVKELQKKGSTEPEAFGRDSVESQAKRKPNIDSNLGGKKEKTLKLKKSF